jgi:hypothetical protein
MVLLCLFGLKYFFIDIQKTQNCQIPHFSIPMLRSFLTKTIDHTICILNAGKTKIGAMPKPRDAFAQIKLQRSIDSEEFDSNMLLYAGTLLGAGCGVKYALGQRETDSVDNAFYVGGSTLMGFVVGGTFGLMPRNARLPVIVGIGGILAVSKGISRYNAKLDFSDRKSKYTRVHQ